MLCKGVLRQIKLSPHTSHCRKNKYTIKQCGSAEKAVEFYKKDLLKNKSLMALIPTLKGKTLGCWCKDEKKPTACHGDVLVELAETYENISK